MPTQRDHKSSVDVVAAFRVNCDGFYQREEGIARKDEVPAGLRARPMRPASGEWLFLPREVA
eukprot:6249362-Alexandrium_andersonii.AAC.1